MKPPRLFEHGVDQALRNAVPLEVEKADSFADFAQLRGDLLAAAGLAAQIRSNVEGRYLFIRIWMIHQIDGLFVVTDFAADVVKLGILTFEVHVTLLNRQSWRRDNRSWFLLLRASPGRPTRSCWLRWAPTPACYA